MKTIDAATMALLLSGDFTDWPLYTLTLANGAGTLRIAASNFPIFDGTHTWVASGVRVSQKGTTGQARWRTGLDVDNWQVSFVPRVAEAGVWPDLINGVPWLEAATQGALDGAELEVSRAYFPLGQPTYPLPPTGALLTGARVVIFAGLMCEVDTNHLMVCCTARDWRCILESQVPVHVFQAGCRHTLFDAGCGLNSAAYPVLGAVEANSTQQIIRAPAVVAPGASNTYALGRLVFLSGDNATFARTVLSWDGTFFNLVNPLPFEPAVGDSFLAYPGCDKTRDTCALFANTVNYGGQPFIPAAETAV